MDEQIAVSEEEEFEQKRPPLSVTIKAILQRYPDGQIFKEMIQNADDAGAKTVWFYIDEREHGISNLPHPDLANFQGPALIAANDACFTDKDWEGIQSLQQSIKAEDPFKVGKFGIGFNSVYHITDLPIIVSGQRLALFDPQHKLEGDKGGRSFPLRKLAPSSDIISPLNGLAGFDPFSVRDKGYPHTIFRLPLRTAPSCLSDYVYDINKLLALLESLREESKYLLLFLKSVCKIEVIRLARSGKQSQLFSVEISPDDIVTVKSVRDSFIQELKETYDLQKYCISKPISYTATFSVVVRDNTSSNNQSGNSRWLVANTVGSADTKVQAAASEQHIFPWVGTVLEVSGNAIQGRIFCFLPLPMETSSGLPVHVNGTFGLNDERRSLKWPSKERRNDATANWNKTLVCELLPLSYVKLLMEAQKYLSPQQFYGAWPDPKILKKTKSEFVEILQPLFSHLFKLPVLWTESTIPGQQTGEWIKVSKATFINESKDPVSLPPVLKPVLSDCGLQLVTAPSVVWRALEVIKYKVKEVSQMSVRARLRSKPDCYSTVDTLGKTQILAYCLSDGCYTDLNGLNLLPLVSKKFGSFDKQLVYLCSSSCTPSLLPNLDNKLVEVSKLDKGLQKRLQLVATCQRTKLKHLTEKEVASLLNQVFPSDWHKSSLVSMPHTHLPPTWLKTFWDWVKDKNLDLFKDQLLIPCYSSTSSSLSDFHLAPLSIAQPVLFSARPCTRHELSALYKMNVRVCIQKEFDFVRHKNLSKYVKQLTNGNSVLDAVASQDSYKNIIFTQGEAESLIGLLANSTPTLSLSNTRKEVLQNLSILVSASNSLGKLYSVYSASKTSMINRPLCESSNWINIISQLPPNIIVFSYKDHYQLKLLKLLKLQFPSDYSLLSEYIFPLIRNGSFPKDLIDELLPKVLDNFRALNSRESSADLLSILQGLSFVKTKSTRKCPFSLFEPSSSNKALYDGEDVFPVEPYTMPDRIEVLKYCGLRATVSLEQLVDIIYSISYPASHTPQKVDSTKFHRAKAVLRYISSPEFDCQTREYVRVPGCSEYLSFSEALMRLCTTRSWLPVAVKRPCGYPQELHWKGSDCPSHFVSLSSKNVILLPSDPCLVGSQTYIVYDEDLKDQAGILDILKTDCDRFTEHAVNHFQVILRCKGQLSGEELNSIVHKVYRYMNTMSDNYLKKVYKFNEWIYISREAKFVSPSIVSLKKNSTFKRDLEPFLFILPEPLSCYSRLFSTASGVQCTVTQSQIMSILSIIREGPLTCSTISASESWEIVMSVLNWITKNGTRKVAEDVLVPIESNLEWPQLQFASKLVVTNIEFMKTCLQKSNEKDDYIFVHEWVNTKLAAALQVQPLSEVLDISEDTFEDAGQSESLLDRLVDILSQYKESGGLTIIKEMLQNADDAEATEINICFDTRSHKVDQKSLYFPGMAKAHGPALIIHNNSIFTDEDFKNITKLAGRTKEKQNLKIGKFGIGFCSVYHMTDVPSFISRDKLFILDPTLTHLKKEVHDHSKPGKIIKFSNRFISGSNQLSPYDGLFGFDRHSEYQGTLFRLPFRTQQSALSPTCYSEEKMKKLKSSIQQSAEKLLLFLQHVKIIRFQQIGPEQTEPELLLTIRQNKIPIQIFPSCSSEIKMIRVTCTQKNSSRHCQWLLSKESFTDCRNKYHTASVACPLGSDTNNYEVNENFEGEMFCFLPLSQDIDIPVHISSNFAVMNNRRGIWTSSSKDSFEADEEVKWNINLMEGVIPKVYYSLLLGLKELASINQLRDYTFYSLWPKNHLKQHHIWSSMLTSLYSLIENSSLFYSEYTQQWLSISEGKFLSQDIFSSAALVDSERNSIYSCILKVLKNLEVPLVNLPHDYYSMIGVSLEMMDESTFTELFFENFAEFACISAERNFIIRRILDIYISECDDQTHRSYILRTCLEDKACIPCGPDGQVFRVCNVIIDPYSKVASLFDESDSYFPIKDISARELSLTALHRLGMIKQKIPWNMLIERAETVPLLYESDKAKALSRTKHIINADTEGEPPKFGTTLSSISFLPVITSPPSINYPLKWKGKDKHLMSGSQLVRLGVANDYDLIAGSQVHFVCESSNQGCDYISERMLSILEIRRAPTVDEVVCHFKELIQYMLNQSNPSDNLLSWTNKACKHIYQFLDHELSANKAQSSHYTLSSSAIVAEPDIDISSLANQPCVWTGKKFVHPNVVIKQWSTTFMSGPYIYSLPTILASSSNFTQAVGIKDEMAFEDIQRVLHEMKIDFQERPVSKECQILLADLVSPLLGIQTNVLVTPADIFLPGKDYVLHSCQNLSYNDTPWLSSNDHEYLYVNSIIPLTLASRLGIKLGREKMLDQFSNSQNDFGIPFGQHEKLTDKIQNILREYPLDITVIKELLQNADDAKATKMFVILDTRQHGTDSVLSENWAELQGPALLVWNNSEFSEADLKGIQKLGVGSKRQLKDSIGKFGIGFNAVYHLTDCPSFISGGKTMCVLDPHYKYVLGATQEKPGMRYDEITKKGFWKRFPDMKSAFLQEKLPNVPDFSEGTLFRFPLRYTEELCKSSNIIDHDSGRSLVITEADMNRMLTEWAPQMKHTLLFLNSVREVHFYEIRESAGKITFKTFKHFVTSIEKIGAETSSRDSTLCDFSDSYIPSVTKYPLTVSEVSHYAYKTEEQSEKWLIQNGIGDLESPNQSCEDKAVNIKQRHGLAAPLKLIKPTQQGESYYRSSGISKQTHVRSGTEQFNGEVFCFLPLPLSSKLPVHINGNFALHANRRELWRSTTTGDVSEKAEWNKDLFTAIASSYAYFLNNAQADYVALTSYRKYHEALLDIDHYYEVFPSAKPKYLSNQYLELAKNVYKTLAHNNAKILGVIESELSSQGGRDLFEVTWHPIRSDHSASQVYFWTKDLHKEITIVIESIGMKLTRAPHRILDCINIHMNDECKLKVVSPEAVFHYYKQFSQQICSKETFPCPLKNTVFKSMTSFLMFIKYLLQPMEQNSNHWTFPSYPFGCPLLVTADEMLREFHQVDKVFNSKYYNLFPKSRDKFLHPELLNMHLPRELFVCIDTTVTIEVQKQQANSVNDDQYSLVKYVLAQELPPELQFAHVCPDYESLIHKETLHDFWECLTNDETFNNFLSLLLKEFALLPATNGSLYSTSNQIKPVYKIETKLERVCYFTVSESDIIQAFEILENLGLPFLDSSIIGDTSIPSCPTLHDVDLILRYVCDLYEQGDLEQCFDKKVVLALVDYFRAIGFKDNLECLTQIKSLPLFEKIDGTFTSLDGKETYIWLDKVCKAGYQKWMSKYDKCVFIKPDSCWTKLGSYEDLKIKKLSAERIYTQFIFPAFSELNEQERYDHLEQIKNKLFYDCERIVKNKVSYAEQWEVEVACLFQNKLVDLPCIGGDNELLLPVKSFCHDQVYVFRTFKTRYRFLPEKFKKTPGWVTFFEHIGLRVSLTNSEYLDLCNAVSRGEHEDVQEASNVLIRHLFSETVRKKQKWHTNLPFLNEVASIPFVCTEKQSEYEWICPAAKPCNVLKSGEKYIYMTKLCDATIPNQAQLLWTVKCVVALPNNYLSSETIQEYGKMLKYLHVTQIADLSLVIQNIQNICALSKLTGQDLFDRYPETIRRPEGGKDLISVISSHFEIIDSASTSIHDYKKIAELPCIPVYGTKDKKFKWQIILVKPQFVITTMCPELEFLHPFIHLLPPTLASVDFLPNIGVHERLQIKHMQLVLEAVYDISKGEELDDNTKKTVVECIKHLYTILKDISEPQCQSLSELENELAPLYLPTVDHTLGLSTQLVYADTPNYRIEMTLDLCDTDYQELSMESTLYKFSDISFCNCLPDSLKPVGLSTISTMHIASSLQEVHDSPVIQLLKNTFSLNILSKGCLSAIRGITKQDAIYKALETPVISFLSNIKVVSLQCLKIHVVLDSSDRTLGEARAPCFFEVSGPGSSSSTLYIDSSLAVEDTVDEPVMLVLDHLMMIIDKQYNISVENLKDIRIILGSLLKAQSGERIRAILEKQGFDLDGIIMDTVEYCIGSEIPQCWKHRLDQNPDNIFHSGEKVGYEKSPGHVVFAEVLDPVLPTGCVGFDFIARIEMQYTVFITKDDEEGQIVGVLDLYKILRSSPLASQPESRELLPYDGETYATRKVLKREDIEDIKKELMEQLDTIWRLPEQDRQKAIKRLYLKWHPDKNPENVEIAEEVFKFLVSEIERRGSTRLPKAKWDSEAKTHGFYWRYEYSAPPSNSREDWWGGTSRSAFTSRSSGGSSGQGTYHPPFDRRDFQIKGDPVEAKRWLRQAVVDAKLLDIMHKALSSEPEIACGVCFQAHQVAEKSLKAGKIYVLGLSEKALKTTKLVTHAFGLQQELGLRASDLPALVYPLEDYLQKTRYPDLCHPPFIPATIFTCEQAAEAVQNAKNILHIIQNIVV